MTTKVDKIKLEGKISENQIDQIVNDFYNKYTLDKKREKPYYFDLSNLEWISNQDLLVLSGLFKYLIDTNANFKVYFLNKGSGENIDKRIAKQIVQIWDVWKIWQLVPHRNYNEVFDIDGTFVDRIKKKFNLSSSYSEIYERYGVTPFICLSKIEDYEDRNIKDFLNTIYVLSAATDEILVNNNCYLPFENKTLNSIITKELYENFLDHFKEFFFYQQKPLRISIHFSKNQIKYKII